MSQTNSAQRIEEASLNAWPALSTLLYDGWLLRFANGYTKRANSVSPLFPSHLAVEEKIDFCESIYNHQQLPSIFRLTSINDLTMLDEQLEARDYKLVDRTQVQTLDLAEVTFTTSPYRSILSGHEGLRAWLDAFHALNPGRMDDQTHEKMLQNIVSPTGAMVLTVQNEVVACGLGVVEGQYLGIFDIVTAKEHRRKGYAAALTQSLLTWGSSLGARTAYLQVMESNTAANRLYSSLGFQECYHYWYRASELNP